MKTILTICLFVVIQVAVSDDIPPLDGFVYLGLAQPQIDASGAVIQKRYWRSTTNAVWMQAYDSCRQQGGSLASPLNPIQDDELRHHLFVENFGGNAWIGAKQSSSVWSWVAHNIPVGYTNWQSATCSSTSNYCAFATGATGIYKWCSTSCSASYSYVCEV